MSQESASAVIILLILAIIGGICYAAESYRCSSVASLMEVPHQYGLVTGCMIKPKDRWIPLERYGEREIN